MAGAIYSISHPEPRARTGYPTESYPLTLSPDAHSSYLTLQQSIFNVCGWSLWALQWPTWTSHVRPVTSSPAVLIVLLRTWTWKLSEYECKPSHINRPWVISFSDWLFTPKVRDPSLSHSSGPVPELAVLGALVGNMTGPFFWITSIAFPSFWTLIPKEFCKPSFKVIFMSLFLFSTFWFLF